MLANPFQQGVQGTLGDQPLGDLTLVSPMRLSALAPSGLEPGTHDLVITNPDGQSVRRRNAYTVPPQQHEIPCGGDYTAYSQFTAARKLFIIERHYTEPAGKQEVLRIGFHDVQKIEVENLDLGDDRACSAVFIVTSDGRRVLFDNSEKYDLTRRAYLLGNACARPVDLVRDDARPSTVWEE